MKRSFAALLAVFASVSAQAGSFGGPPPFSNGSPLTTGVDGSYQASVRGSNLSGVIKFSYAGGVQNVTSVVADIPANLAANAWVVFYQGQVYSGSTEAAINDQNIAGVLETSTAAAPATPTIPITPVTQTTSTTSTVSTTVPAGSVTRTTSQSIAFVNPPSGYFNAKFSKNSPTGSFKGNGILSGNFNTTTVNNSTVVDPTAGASINNSTTATPGTFEAPFKVKGVRASTTGK